MRKRLEDNQEYKVVQQIIFHSHNVWDKTFKEIAIMLSICELYSVTGSDWTDNMVKRIFYSSCPFNEQRRKWGKDNENVSDKCSVPGCNNKKMKGNRFLCERHFKNE